MKSKFALAIIVALVAGMHWGQAAPVVLTIESWRNDDLAIWRDKIIPVFEKAHPDIKVRFVPTAPAEYNAVLNSRLDAGTAGDLIACRPFDVPLRHFEKKQLLSVNDIKGTAAHHRRPGRSHRGTPAPPRGTDGRGAAVEARHRHGVPELRAVSAPERGKQYGAGAQARKLA